MHVRSVSIENVRSIRSLEWSLPEGAPAEGWHVVLGNNGSGKSSFLRSIALALVGPEDLYGLRQKGDDWLRRGTSGGSISVVFERHPGVDVLSGPGRAATELGAYVRIERSSSGAVLVPDTEADVRGKSTERSVWASDARGWFVAGFGPFRRFDGGDPQSGLKPNLARNLSLFDERFALRDALSWLIDLWVAKVAGSGPSQTFDRVMRFVNQEGFLPHGAQLSRVEVSEAAKRVVFADGAGVEVPVEELSDGFRSVLSLTLELLRQVVLAFGAEAVFEADDTRVNVPGVVLVDEVDAHLHPTWQRRIGDFLVRAFPRMQFIVTTHSPLVCRSARDGTVFLLPDPGADEVGRMLSDEERGRLVFGNVLDAYSTGAFGVGVEQSDDGREAQARLAELNAKELFGAPLDESERVERESLRTRLPSAAAEPGSAQLDALIAKLTAPDASAGGG